VRGVGVRPCPVSGISAATEGRSSARSGRTGASLSFPVTGLSVYQIDFLQWRAIRKQTTPVHLPRLHRASKGLRRDARPFVDAVERLPPRAWDGAQSPEASRRGMKRYHQLRIRELAQITRTMKTDIESLIREERWGEARKAITTELRNNPTSHWLIARLGLTYYEQRRYSLALKFAARALELAPRCPLALWDYAGALQMLDRDAEAIPIYRRLIRRGPLRMANGPCGEGLAWSRGLIADCHLRLSDSMHALGDEAGAERHFDKHLEMRGPGCQSIYPLKDIAARRG
jgi:hypothetical protein